MQGVLLCISSGQRFQPCDGVHVLGAYLDLYLTAFGEYHSVQGLIAI